MRDDRDLHAHERIAAMESKHQIPGLNLLNAEHSQATGNMTSSQSTSTSIPSPLSMETASSEKAVTGGLVGLEAWLKSNPEPEHQTQSKKAKSKLEPATITPIIAEKELSETNWIGKLFGTAHNT